MAVADPIARLVKELARLPGIGEKSAQRLAFHILKAGPGYAADLAAAIAAVVRDVRLCSSCQTLTDRDPCPHLPRRPARPAAALRRRGRAGPRSPIERTHEFRGRYHVLHGALSPLDGVGPGDLKIRELLVRLERSRPTRSSSRRTPTSRARRRRSTSRSSSSRSASRSRASRKVFPWAATSNTLTRSRWRAPSPADGSCDAAAASRRPGRRRRCDLVHLPPAVPAAAAAARRQSGATLVRNAARGARLPPRAGRADAAVQTDVRRDRASAPALKAARFPGIRP